MVTLATQNTLLLKDYSDQNTNINIKTDVPVTYAAPNESYSFRNRPQTNKL